MDLSNLSKDLPNTIPINQNSIQELNKEISNEFKIGARSIAALYKLSTNKFQIVKLSGYLDCLNDIKNLINGGNIDDENDDQKSKTTINDFSDLNQWISNKINEISPNQEQQDNNAKKTQSYESFNHQRQEEQAKEEQAVNQDHHDGLNDSKGLSLNEVVSAFKNTPSMSKSDIDTVSKTIKLKQRSIAYPISHIQQSNNDPSLNSQSPALSSNYDYEFKLSKPSPFHFPLTHSPLSISNNIEKSQRSNINQYQSKKNHINHMNHINHVNHVNHINNHSNNVLIKDNSSDDEEILFDERLNSNHYMEDTNKTNIDSISDNLESNRDYKRMKYDNNNNGNNNGGSNYGSNNGNNYGNSSRDLNDHRDNIDI
ncbi:hypothetical protein B5S33_g459 [[Candida] boidinii]|nr:hypothetical protein B5S33_g459 [[Candida] boidinii]